MLDPGTSVSAFSPGQAAASSEVKHARAGKEDAAPTATSIWASVAVGRLQVCKRYGKEDAVLVAIEQKDQDHEGKGSNIAAARDRPSRTVFLSPLHSPCRHKGS